MKIRPWPVMITKDWNSLGDAVLELCVSDLLMKKFPDYTEGQLSQLRASVVKRNSPGEPGENFKIGDYLLLGKGEESSGGRTKPSLLSNTLEALLAAIYLDSSFSGSLRIHQPPLCIAD